MNQYKNQPIILILGRQPLNKSVSAPAGSEPPTIIEEASVEEEPETPRNQTAGMTEDERHEHYNMLWKYAIG